MLLSKVLRKPQLVFRVAEPKDKESILKFLNTHFTKEEPCARALKLTPEDAIVPYTETINRCLNYPFSVVAHQENGNIVACFLGSVWNRHDKIEKADFKNENVPENLKLFLEFLNSAHSNFWKIAPPNIHSVIHAEMGSVAPEFTRQGLATKINNIVLNNKNLKKYNIGGVLSESTSLANQIVMEKIGFKCLKELPFSSIVDSKGNQVLKLDDGTKALRLHFKAIENLENLPE